MQLGLVTVTFTFLASPTVRLALRRTAQTLSLGDCVLFAGVGAVICRELALVSPCDNRKSESPQSPFATPA